MPFTPRETPPETQPAGTRWLPPSLPPAPPGGGTGGPPGGGSFRRGQGGGAPGEPDIATEFYPLLNDLAVARTTFEVVNCYPDDQALRSELMAIIEDARGNLRRKLDALLEKLATEQPPYTDDVLRGLQTSLLSSSPPFGTFSLILIRSREALAATPPREFVLLVLDHFTQAVQDDASYHSGASFEATVFNDFQALLFAAERAYLEW